MDKLNENPETGCCSRFNPEQWDEKILEWKDRRFIKDMVFTFFYMPLNFGSVMKRLDEQVRKSGAKTPGFLCLFDHTSKWNTEVYLAVDREIPDAKNVTLSWKFLSNVYGKKWQTRD